MGLPSEWYLPPFCTVKLALQTTLPRPALPLPPTPPSHRARICLAGMPVTLGSGCLFKAALLAEGLLCTRLCAGDIGIWD